MSRLCTFDFRRPAKVGPFVAGLFLMFAVVGVPSPTAAGPPFLTDDPEPVDYGRWEIISFSMGTMVQGDSAGILPGMRWLSLVTGWCAKDRPVRRHRPDADRIQPRR